MFNSREQALIIWLVVFLLYILSVKSVRSSIPKILKAMIVLLKHPIFIFTNIYIIAVFISMYYFKLLERGVTKDYVVWIFLSLYPIIIKVSTNYMELNIPSILKEIFKLSIVPIFIINEYTLPLWAELIINPILFFIGVMWAFTEFDETHVHVKKFLTFILVLIVLIFIVGATIGITSNYKDTFNIDFWQKMFFDVIGIILHLPLLFFLRYMCFYEQVLVRINIQKKHQKFLAIILVFFKLRFKENSLKELVRNHRFRNIRSLEELKNWFEVELS